MSMRLLAFILLLTSTPSLAQQSLIGSAGNYTAGTSQAAAMNRRVADQLLQQSIADEKTALSTFPPNIGLLAKAGVMAMDGIKADQQAQHFAKAAMNGINSGTNAGQFDTKNYGGLNQSQINDLATSNSPYRATAQSHIEGWGFKVSPDGSTIGLPLGLGSVPLSLGLSAIESGMKGAARMLGYETSDITNGIQQAVATRDAIARKAQAESETMLGAASATLTTATGATPEETPVGQEASAKASEIAAAVDDPSSKQVDILEQEAQLDRYRNQLKATMGLSDIPVVGRVDQNIFKMVTLRYQVLRRQDAFIESSDQVLASGH